MLQQMMESEQRRVNDICQLHSDVVLETLLEQAALDGIFLHSGWSYQFPHDQMQLMARSIVWMGEDYFGLPFWIGMSLRQYCTSQG